MRTHYSVHAPGREDATKQWQYEGLVPSKVKFCDGLMLRKDRHLDFTKSTEWVDCKKCLKKIEVWEQNNFDLPY